MILWRRWWGWIGNDLHLDDVPRYAVLHFNLHVHYKVENFVGVIWLFSCLSSFWRLDIHSETCCNSKFMMTHQQTLNWKLDQSSFSYGYWKRLFVDLLIEYIGPRNCAFYWVWSSLKTSFNFFLKHESLWFWLVLWFSPNHKPIRNRGSIKKRDQVTPGYLMAIIQFFFLLVLYWSKWCLEIHVAIANIWWNINQKWIDSRTCRDLVVVLGSVSLQIP